MTIVLTGLASGFLIFIVSSGLTLVLGVMRIVNFAHGAFFMLGAYLAFQLQQGREHPLAVFVTLVVAAGLLAAIVGVVVERLILRRFYSAEQETVLLATFALLLLLQGAVQLVWGNSQQTQPRPTTLGGALEVAGAILPRYDVLLMAAGLLVFACLQWLVYGSRLGRQIMAVSEDPYMASLLGVSLSRIYTITFGFAIFLAGLGGGLAAPTLSMTPGIAANFILYAFAVVIIGGFGSISGSLIASLLLGLLASALGSYAPGLADFALYIPMLLILVIRPQGLRPVPAREVVVS